MDRPFITRMRYDYSVRCVAVDRVTGIGIGEVASRSPIRRRQTVVGYDEIGDLDLHSLIILV